ncbi:hemolysin III family protein [Bacillus sp. JCM 19041]|uniref:PAQR family membrane homeostasis protein TrhA n=1 Tax=Bacillus sp. JCM 19041 TaxID=1460637 RepID=UPI0006CFDAAC
MAETHVFSRREEIANAITHGIGAVLSIAALTLLIVYSSIYGTAWHVVSFTIYGASMLLLYVSSTLVHSFPAGKAKDLFEIFDHAAIYVFIAGTYTPILLILVGGGLGWTLFGIVWGIAFAGILFKVFFVKKFLFFSTVLYLAMGWLAIFAIKPIYESLSTTGIWFLVIGGLFYTIGTIFYMWRGFRYHHAVWHLFVIAGSIFHFFLVFIYVLPVNV